MSYSKFDESYKKLNAAQKKAVDTIDGPVMVVAGPGSGKTEILSLRVANILRMTDATPGNILCLTFTDSAAVNMRKRLVALLGNAAYRIPIHTFHGFGVEVINSYPEYFWNGASLLPADALVSIHILEEIFSELPHDNPLSSKYDDSFTYISDAKSAIENLKKGGLSPDEFRAVLSANEEFLKYANPLVGATFSERLSKKDFDNIGKLTEKLRTFVSGCAVPLVWPLAEVVAESLSRALDSSVSEDTTTFISEWKKKWIEKNDEGKNVLKGTASLPKLFALADVYEAYQETMRKEGYYDFADMILDTVQTLEKTPSLRYELQERYQYILVDEFQDTNDAQMRLVRLLTDAPVHEGRPNVMVVGDDDQAVYKFQGADISNILSFREMYRDPVVITMTENYRSTQKVLDLARHVILKGDERLENKIPEMEKRLTAGNTELSGGAIVNKVLRTRVHEYHFVAAEIRKLIDNGKPASEIAVIARKHKYLEGLVPFLHRENIPINYERQQNVFLEPHVRELILLSRFITSLSRKNRDEADELLPEILSFPFWGLSRKVIWEISVSAERSNFHRKKWIDVMREHENEKVRTIADFLIDLGDRSKNETLEQVLDALMGSDLVSLTFSEDEDIETPDRADIASGKFVSPFKEFYFSREKFEKNKAEFLIFLSSLRVFVEALREHKQGAPLRIEDIVSFVELHEKNNIQVTDTSPFISGADSVTLLSAHKAKGMEFDTVFILSCQNDVWAGRGKNSILPFPKNLPLSPAGDTLDDKLRIFYVAITRAKKHLYLTSYCTDDKGDEMLPLEFLAVADGEEVENENVRQALAREYGEDEEISDETILSEAWKAVLAPPFVADERALLHSLLEDYQMSVTHLNNFLDVSHGGPQAFLENNLLRFPQAKGPAGAYGTAMHGAIERTYTYLKREGKLPKKTEIEEWFEELLSHERLSARDHRHFLKQGHDALAVYLKEKMPEFDASHRIETNFKDQGVVLGEARITGKIDKMIPVGDSEMRVVDFKTGKAAHGWEGKTPEEKIKLYKYRRQLMFYKLLVENSRDFGKYVVNEGVLEFLEPDRSGKICELIAEIGKEETERTARLIEVVYKKIIALDLPDISDFPKDLKGIIAFEDTLLS